MSGRIYTFDEKEEYDFESAAEFEMADKAEPYGDFFIEGKIEKVDVKDEIPVYKAEGNDLSFCYSYTDRLLNAGEKEWHLIDDKAKKLTVRRLIPKS